MTTSISLPVREGSDSDAGQAVVFGSALKKMFPFDPKWRNMNHGSFGSLPNEVRKVQRAFQNEMEERPDAFIRYSALEYLDQSRAAIAKYINAPVETVVFVSNATTGVDTVLRNIPFEQGDKIVYFDTIYGACEKIVQHVCEITPAESAKISYTYPVSDDFLVDSLRETVARERAAGSNPKIVIFDTIVSLPGVRMPFERLTQLCRELGVLSLVDGAHGVGHLPLDMTALDPDFFVSNCHKWLFVPRGCAVFYTPIRNQHLIRTTTPTSHGFIALPKPNTTPIPNPLPPSPNSPYITNFQFVGTIDNTPYLCLPAAIRFRTHTLGGEAAIISYCHALARGGGARVAQLFGTEVLENAAGTLGAGTCFSNVALPLGISEAVGAARAKGAAVAAPTTETAAQGEAVEAAVGKLVRDWICDTAQRQHGTFFAVIFYARRWWVRLSAQVYLDMGDFEWSARVLQDMCERARAGEFVPEPRAML